MSTKRILTSSVETREPSMKGSLKHHSMHLAKLLIAALPTIVFGVFTVVFTLQQDASAKATREQDQRQADEVNRRQIFKEYIDDMAELLLHEDFERNVSKALLHIRVQTLTALKHLDAVRKHDVIVFLYENRLIRYGEPHLVMLHGADLSGMKFQKSPTERCDFTLLYLPGIYAENIIFSSCVLSRAVFERASMAGATFDSCNVFNGSFAGANLTRARIHGNQLLYANFAGSDLTRTSIQGGVFQEVNFANADLYQSDIDDSLLYPTTLWGMKPNVILNSRFPNGSMSDLNVNTLVTDGRAQTQTTKQNEVKLINGSQLDPAAMAADTCFYGVDKDDTTIETFMIFNFSLLIDLEQAMLNFSALVGLKHTSSKDEIVVFVHFADAEGAFDYGRSFRS